ncbi:Crp/Fnr family transcriptional regulator [Microvirga sp. VF16]|uniref:Crp/Fnr family transcriptional regulator n=1 Tax=Microvirga sp. VF16 TaxID=2807101 RepID=UPI00193D6087|nr:Crp/Fnr family transcriptional regulator [Microvirga sp. VF16]QRM34103.1 Crp/Fnr family transcriptional regulator [Microvirga sp. VF16]
MRADSSHRANRLLAALEPEDFASLEPHLELVHLQRRQVLYETGGTIRFAYFPHDMVISLVAVMHDCSSAEMSVYGPEGVAGLLAAAVANQSFGRYIAQMAGSASRISLDKMFRLMRERPRIQAMVRHFAEATMARVLQSVACNALHSVEARSCRFILTIYYRINQDTLALTHEFLAERLGVQRTTVSAVMSKLQAKGLIKQAKGGIIVTDPVGLEAEACECYGRVRDILERLLPYAPSER